MTDAEIMQGLELVAERHLGWHGELRPDTRLIEDLELDSLRLLTLVVELENHFRVKLEDGDEVGITTIGELVAVLRRRCAT